MGDYDSMSVDSRLLYLKLLVEAVILGPHLNDQRHRQAIAGHLYSQTAAAERHQSFPAEVLAALNQTADSLAEIDNMPDALKPALRPLIPPASPQE